MGITRKLLIDQIKSEFSELNQYAIAELLASKTVRLNEEFFQEYTLPKINKLFYSKKATFKTEKDLLSALKLYLDKNYYMTTNSRKKPLLHIPIFIYLLGKSSLEDDFLELCMKIHLTKDKESIFSPKRQGKLTPSYKLDVVDVLDRVFLDKDYSPNLETIITLLDYIDYEKSINGGNSSLYLKYLDARAKDLYAYLCFAGSNKLLEEYSKNRAKHNHEYKYKNSGSIEANINLIRSFIDMPSPRITNRFLIFKVLEDRLKKGTFLEERKNSMLIFFSYRRYPYGDFYKDFKDIDLSLNDLLNFINIYESKGQTLTPSQFENILVSYRNSYLERTNQHTAFKTLCQSVKEEFNEYRKSRYAFYPSKFIAYYNEKHQNDTAFETSNHLTRQMYELIINGNNLVGFDCLKDTYSYRNYILKNKKFAYDPRMDEANYQRMKATYEKYYDLLDEINFTAEFTIDYIIRKYVKEEDLDDFLDLKSWFDEYYAEKWDYSGRVQKRTTEQVYLDFEEALQTGPFSARLKTYQSYINYAANDRIQSYADTEVLNKMLRTYERKFIEKNAQEMFSVVLNASNSNLPLTPVLEELGLSIQDLDVIFASLGEEFLPKIKVFKDTATSEAKDISKQKKAERKEARKKKTQKLVIAYLRDETSTSIIDFCRKNSIPISSFKEIRELIESDEELNKAFMAKTSAENSVLAAKTDCEVSQICEMFAEGIPQKDGTKRPFNYLDYCLITNMPVQEFAKLAINKYGPWDELSQFTGRHQRLPKYSVTDLLTEKYVVMVKGELHEVTEQEKQSALQFIEERDLPRETKVYSLVVRAALNGEINLENGTVQEKKFVKTPNEANN